jgi:hypothetical protein
VKTNTRQLFPFLHVDVTADPGLSAACFLSLKDAIADVWPPLGCSKEITSQNSKTCENKGMRNFRLAEFETKRMTPESVPGDAHDQFGCLPPTQKFCLQGVKCWRCFSRCLRDQGPNGIMMTFSHWHEGCIAVDLSMVLAALRI